MGQRTRAGREDCSRPRPRPRVKQSKERERESEGGREGDILHAICRQSVMQKSVAWQVCQFFASTDTLDNEQHVQPVLDIGTLASK